MDVYITAPLLLAVVPPTVVLIALLLSYRQLVQIHAAVNGRFKAVTNELSAVKDALVAMTAERNHLRGG